MAQKFIGIDLGFHTVKVCVVSVGFRSVEVLGYETIGVDTFAAEEANAEGDDGEADDLARALSATLALIEQRGWKEHPAAIALPSGEASYRGLSFPFADPKRVAQAVGFEVQGQFPVPLEELAHDHITVPPPKKGDPGRALVVAVRGETVERVTRAFRDFGVDLRLVTVGSVATAQALENLEVFVPPVPEVAEGQEPPVVGDITRPTALVLDVGHQGTEMIAMTKQGPLAARTLRRGSRQVDVTLARAYKMSLPDASAAKLQHAFLPHEGLGELGDEQRKTAEAVARALAPILREIEHTRRWLENECDAPVTEIRIAGGGSQMIGFDAWLAEQTGLLVRPLHPELPHKLKAPEGIDWSQMMAAFGAAVGAGRRPLLQLRELDSMSGGISFFEERFGTLFTLGAAILAFAAVESVVAIKTLEKERNAYEQELAAASEQVFGEPMFSADEVVSALEGVDGGDLTDMVPDRGAFETLAMVHRVAMPGPSPAPMEQPAEVGPDGMPTGEPTLALAPVPDDAGVVRDDELELSYVEIGPLKIKMIVSATRTTTQDRFARKLKEIECISGVTKGKIRDKAGRKEFEMNIDHSCYTQSVEIEAPEAEENPAAAVDEMDGLDDGEEGEGE